MSRELSCTAWPLRREVNAVSRVRDERGWADGIAERFRATGAQSPGGEQDGHDKGLQRYVVVVTGHGPSMHDLRKARTTLRRFTCTLSAFRNLALLSAMILHEMRQFEPDIVS